MTEVEKEERRERNAWTKEFIERLATVDKQRAMYKRACQEAGIVVDAADADTWVPGGEAAKLREELADARSAFEVERGRYAVLHRALNETDEKYLAKCEECDSLKSQLVNRMNELKAADTELAEAWALLRRMGDGPRAIGRHALVINAMLDEAWKKANKR
jgi:hypothetical protein